MVNRQVFAHPSSPFWKSAFLSPNMYEKKSIHILKWEFVHGYLTYSTYVHNQYKRQCQPHSLFHRSYHNIQTKNMHQLYKNILKSGIKLELMLQKRFNTHTNQKLFLNHIHIQNYNTKYKKGYHKSGCFAFAFYK